MDGWKERKKEKEIKGKDKNREAGRKYGKKYLLFKCEQSSIFWLDSDDNDYATLGFTPKEIK